MSLSLTLAVLKPDLVLHPMHLAAVRRAIVESEFWVVRRFQLLALDKKFVLVYFFSSAPWSPLARSRRRRSTPSTMASSSTSALLST